MGETSALSGVSTDELIKRMRLRETSTDDLINQLGIQSQPALGAGLTESAQPLLSQLSGAAPLPPDIPEEGGGIGGFIQSALTGDAAGSFLGELGGGAALGALGGLALGPPGAIAGALGGGALGAAGGLSARRALAGKAQPDAIELATESALSLLPQAVTRALGPVVKGPIRELLKRSNLGQDVVAKFIKDSAEAKAAEVLKAPAKEEAARLFNLVRQSGETIDGSFFASSLKRFDDVDFKAVAKEINKIPSGPNYDAGLGADILKRLDVVKRGTRPGALTTDAIAIKNVSFDIGEMHQLRSVLKKQAFEVKDSARKDTLFDAVRAIDDAVDAGLGTGSPGKQLLADARKQYFLAATSEDFANVLGDSVKNISGRDAIRLDTGKLRKNLTNPKNRASRDLVANLEKASPGSPKVIVDFIQDMEKLFPTVVIEGGITGSPGKVLATAPIAAVQVLPFGNAAVSRLGDLLANTRGRDYVQRTLIETNGRLSINAIGLGLNAIRRSVTTPEGNAEISRQLLGTP